eukprot:TRINITY_DN1778_c1_g1_i1.p1 TRINITY_DN1778_c1_g1~~TRINITY_DN1778_c1_g1_i1.p1  ORF type:complete len:231 (+),score=37.98 TRINITY_DN1778_c1_g1_i1:53-694(+)
MALPEIAAARHIPFRRPLRGQSGLAVSPDKRPVLPPVAPPELPPVSCRATRSEPPSLVFIAYRPAARDERTAARMLTVAFPATAAAVAAAVAASAAAAGATPGVCRRPRQSLWDPLAPTPPPCILPKSRGWGQPSRRGVRVPRWHPLSPKAAPKPPLPDSTEVSGLSPAPPSYPPGFAGRNMRHQLGARRASLERQAAASTPRPCSHHTRPCV